MLGAIIGDLAGSTYEVEEFKSGKKGIPYEKRIQILDRSIPLFPHASSYTDDTVLTVSIAESLLQNGDYEFYLKKYGNQEIDLGVDAYGKSRFGSGFVEWLKGNTDGNSYGNGCAMRISPIPNYFSSLDEVLEETRKATIPSHNHPESLEAASAVATAIFLANQKKRKDEIKAIIEKNYSYDLTFSLENLQRNYRFTVKASDSVPQAIYCFLISVDFEDAIRKAISIGGDTDTIAAITGSIAEAYYGIPNEIVRKVWLYLPEYIQKSVKRFYLRLDFFQFLKREKMDDRMFWQYIQSRTHRLPSDTQKSWFGCFPVVTEDNILTEIKVLVPEIENLDSLLVNIHEFTRAFELYQELNGYYEEDMAKREKRAKEKEKNYIKRLHYPWHAGKLMANNFKNS